MCQDRPAKEAGQAILHDRQNVATNLATVHPGQSAGVGRGGEDLVRRRRAWPAANEPFRREEAQISGTSSASAAGVHLQGVTTTTK